MALVLKDRVQEQTAVTGDSPAVLLGEIAGYQSFANSTPNASVVYYTIAGGTEWEVGYGTYYTNNNSVVRVTSQVYASSNAGAIVNFSAGTKNIFVTMPAEQAVYQETDGSLKLIGGIIEVSLDGTESGNALPNVAFQAFSTIDSYMQSNMQNLDSGASASADYVITADEPYGTDTNNYIDLGMASSGYNYPEFGGIGALNGYIQATGSALVIQAGKYGANVAAANASATDIVFQAGDLLAGGERARIKGSTGNIILANTANPTDTGSKLQVTGNVSITGNVAVTANLTVGADPTTALQVATKQYVDTAVSTGLHIHQPVRLAQPTNLTATYTNGASGVGANLTNSGTQVALVVDTITANVADRILVFAQSNAVQNGVYVVADTGSNATNWVLTRASDADTYAPQSDTGLGGGDYFYVQSGATQAGDSYVCTNEGNITFGVSNITFTQFSGAITYVGGTNINVSGQTISVDGTIGVTNGGTGINTVSTGDIIYANAGNSFTNLTVGSTGQTLIVSGGAPAWGALDMAGSGVAGTLPANHGGTGFATYAIGDIIYANSATTLDKVAPNNTTTQKVLTQTGNGVSATSTAWNQLSAADITGLGTMAVQNASAVTITGGFIDDTAIGGFTPATGAFTNLTATANVSGTGFANYLNAPPSIGGVTPNTGAFTQLQGANITALTGFIGNGASISNINGANVSTGISGSNITAGVVGVAYGGTGLTSAGDSGNILTSNGTAWTSSPAPAAGLPAVGNSSIGLFNVNITANATINAGVNGFSVGPVTTANGVVVTVTSGQQWVVI